MKLDEARSYLAVDKHNLDEELVQQPQLYERVGQELAMAQTDLASAKKSLEKMESELLDDLLRKDTGRTSMEKLKSKLHFDPELQRMHAVLRSREEDVRMWTHMLEAFKARGYSIRDLAALYNANYYQRDSVSFKGNARDAEHRRVRERFAEERTQRRRPTSED